MAAYTCNRTVNWAIVILIIMNLALLATIWYPRINPPKKETAQPKAAIKKNRSPRDKDNRLERRARIAGFLEKELGFSREQVDKFFRLREEHFQRSEELRRQIDDLRKEMMDQLLAEKPGTARVEKLAAAMGQKMAAHEKAVFNHFVDLMAVCNAEQQVKYRALLRDILRQLAPPEERRPGEQQPPPRDSGARQDRREPPRREDRPTPIGQPEEGFKQGSRPNMQQPPPQTRRQGETGHEQNKPGPQNRQGMPGSLGVDGHIRMLRQQLRLTDSQVEKIRPILEEAMTKLQQIPRDPRYRGHEERRQARDKVHQWEDGRVEAILTAEQKKRYREIKKKRKNPGPNF
ncbi:MAG: periplasmic heavy metal sensor [Candidatus Aminicenantes bacterium]|nr:periplasmic heavy metal sensor [Candidatus Aminicenantes bacterium]